MGKTATSLIEASAREAAHTALVWVSDHPVPANVQQALVGRYALSHQGLNESFDQAAQTAQAVVIYPGETGANIRELWQLLDSLERTPLVGLVLLGPDDWRCQPLLGRHGHFTVSRADNPPEILAAQVDSLLQLRPALDQLRREIDLVRSAGVDLGNALGDIDEEMRLAARLQRDFLPKQMPEVGALRFSVMYRPASWVSGDIYSVERLDEQHIGFYVADAVGHGLPAALLTMFIKRALPTKGIDRNSYEIIPPDRAMAALNDAICDQDLSSCQFCTALHCIVNAQTLEMTYARGGHPEAIWLRRDGRMDTLGAAGALLGITPGESFELARVQLAPGDRVVLCTDGAEDAFRQEGQAGRDRFVSLIEQFRDLPAQEMTFRMAAEIDAAHGSLHPADDITLLVLDVAV